MKSLIKKVLYRMYGVVNHFPLNNRVRLRGTKIVNSGKLLIRSKIDCKGSGNVIIFHKGGGLLGTSLTIRGNDNVIEIGVDTSIVNGELHVEDNNNRITFGNNTTISGKTHFACIEGCVISIGNDCLFSSDIVLRTGDSHSITDLYGNRINPSQDIVIGNHVWIGSKVTITKGVVIAENSIIGTGAIVTKSFSDTNIVLAGNPAKIIRHDVNWCRERKKI